MASDSTEAFAADIDDTRKTREDLERELAALDAKESTDPATIADPDATGPEDDPDAEEFVRPIVQVRNDLLGRDIGIIRPTDVDIVIFQNDMGSKVLNDNQRMARNGDFCREHVVEADYEKWERAVRSAAARQPRRGAVIFYEAMQELVTVIIDQVEETDEAEMTKAMNRAERRAALKAKANRGR